MLSRKVMIISFIASQIRNTQCRYILYDCQYFYKPYERQSESVKVELYLSNYGTKAYLKVAIGGDISNLARKSDVASLKAGVNKQDIHKQKIVTAHLSKLSNAVMQQLFKKCV